MNDILPAVNAVLKTNHENLDQVSDRELTRAYMILRIQALLGDTPSVEYPTLFYQLEPGATFLINGEGRTLEKRCFKIYPAPLCDVCAFPTANAKRGEQRVHVCPDTPVLEVLF